MWAVLLAPAPEKKSQGLDQVRAGDSARCQAAPASVIGFERLLLPDAVEKVAFTAKRRVLIETVKQGRLTSCHRQLSGEADLGELAQVLG
ncbi:MAG: hypothetical protein KGQ75_12320, partial [Sphingomonadales bacterium]|nr:hypothetical protein [Sphingomonadales bacterium]